MVSGSIEKYKYDDSSRIAPFCQRSNGRLNYCRKQPLGPIFVFVLVLFLFLIPGRQLFCQDWQELKGEHFIVYFTQEDSFAKNVLDKAEVYYRNIAIALGYPRYSEFWIWDKRVKIYIYPGREDYLMATGEPGWSQGMADYKKKEITSYILNKGFLDSLLPHEIAHLIFRDFVGFKGQVPLWLDEGVAQWAEETKRDKSVIIAKQLFKSNKLFSLDDMMKLDIRNVRDKDKVYIRSIQRTKEGVRAVLCLSSDNLIGTYYIQAVSLVRLLIESHGSDNFAEFCRQLRDGKALEEALRFAYPTYLRSLDELEDMWREYLAKRG